MRSNTPLKSIFSPLYPKAYQDIMSMRSLSRKMVKLQRAMSILNWADPAPQTWGFASSSCHTVVVLVQNPDLPSSIPVEPTFRSVATSLTSPPTKAKKQG